MDFGTIIDRSFLYLLRTKLFLTLIDSLTLEDIQKPMRVYSILDNSR